MEYKDRFLPLVLSVVVSPLIILIFAVFDIAYTNKSIETFVRGYVEHFTESAANQLDKGDTSDSSDGSAAASHPFDKIQQPERLFGQYPAYLAVLSRDGKFLYGAEKLRKALAAHASWLNLDRVSEIVFNDAFDREKFTIAKFQALDGEYLVVGGISWREMPGDSDISIFLWQTLIVLVILWNIHGVSKLLNKALLPLDELEKTVSSLRWGYDTLSLDMNGSVPSVMRLYHALVNISNDVANTTQTHRIYMQDLVNVLEDERRKISRDIHDGPLQDVTALIQRMRLARSHENTEADTRRELDLAEKIAFTSVKEMRALCDFLNPPWLELGLSQALTELTERQADQYGIKIFLGIDEDVKLSDAITLAFFRVVQEAITNSVKHGEAKNIWIDINGNGDGGVELTIQDDGYGFELQKNGIAGLRAEGHRGLSNMEERVSLVSGQLKIISYKGEGTCIRVVIPGALLNNIAAHI